MPKGTKNPAAKNDTGANLGYEAELWKAADALRGIDGQIGHGDSFHNDRFPDPSRPTTPLSCHRALQPCVMR